MPLFVDPKARVRLTFPDDCDVPELRGEWIDVRESIGSAAWREFQAGAVSVTPGGDTDWQAAFSGANGLKRLAQWIEATSFVDGRGRAYPPQNMHDRMAWLGELWPPAGTEIDVILSQHIASAFDTAQPVEHPKAEPSSDPDPAESTQPPTDE